MPCHDIIKEVHSHSEHAPLGFSMINSTQQEKYELDQRLCLDPATVSELYLYGNELSEETAHFTIHVEKCVNTTTFKTCKPQQYIDKYFKDIKLNVIFVN